MLRIKGVVALNRRVANVLVTSFNANSTAAPAQCDNKRIVLPKRIKRGPTDILRALANTVGADPTAAHYKYHDDPYLTPYSESNKQTFALAQESGRKTARWIKNEHADLFQVNSLFPSVIGMISSILWFICSI